jgi:hypothetical protein
MGLELRPLTLAELLDRSFSTYKRHLWLFVGIMAIPASVALLYAVAMQVFQFVMGFPGRGAAPPTPDQLFRTMLPMAIGALAFFAVYMVVYAFALGATTIAVAHLYKDRAVTVGAAYREVKRHGGRLLLLMLWIVLRVGGMWFGVLVLCGILSAVLALVSPVLTVLTFGIGMIGAFGLAAFMWVRYGVAIPAVVLENRTAGQALARSVQLTSEHRGRVFLLILCAVVVTYATAALLQGPFVLGAMISGPGSVTALVLTLVGAVLGTMGSTFSGPIMIIGLAMLYYDLRIRKEALDLQMMLEALDAKSAPAAGDRVIPDAFDAPRA